jgi:hypothetical protein
MRFPVEWWLALLRAALIPTGAEYRESANRSRFRETDFTVLRCDSLTLRVQKPFFDEHGAEEIEKNLVKLESQRD